MLGRLLLHFIQQGDVAHPLAHPPLRVGQSQHLHPSVPSLDLPPLLLVDSRVLCPLDDSSDQFNLFVQSVSVSSSLFLSLLFHLYRCLKASHLESFISLHPFFSLFLVYLQYLCLVLIIIDHVCCDSLVWSCHLFSFRF